MIYIARRLVYLLLEQQQKDSTDFNIKLPTFPVELHTLSGNHSKIQ